MKYRIVFTSGRGIEVFLNDSELQEYMNVWENHIDSIYKGKDNECIYSK